MKFGWFLPHVSEHASPEAIAGTARQAEQLGYDSLWVFDRLLYPVHPKTPYPGSPDGKLPDATRRVFEPLVTLSYVAALTQKIRLGTGVMVSAFRSPVLLARMAATLDQVSNGRFLCGVGMGWSQDEYEASGVGFTDKGARFDEYLQCMQAVWTQDEPEFHGQYYTCARSLLQPQPVQKPMALWIGGDTPAALRRAAKHGTGWYGSGYLPFDQVVQAADTLRKHLAEEKRDPRAFAITLWMPFGITPKDTPGALMGSPQHIATQLRALQKAGIDEITLLGVSNPMEDFHRFPQEIRPLLDPTPVP